MPGSHCSSIQQESPEEYLSILFDVCKTEDGKADIKVFFEELAKTGIRRTDPRLSKLIKMLNMMKPKSVESIDQLRLESSLFKSIVSENIVLITKAFKNQMVIPAFESFCENITDIYNICKKNHSGKVYDAIPQLAAFNNDQWGISICTVDGQRFSIGDAKVPFSIQAISKPITYAVTMSELGEELVHKYQGKEPSGRKINEIVLDHNNKPHNPLINSGALVSASLILQLVKPELHDFAEKYDYLFLLFEKLCGNEHMQFNNSTFLAQKSSIDRDYALAFFMRENGCFPPNANIKNILEFYFQTCSLEMDCESNAILAATLANGGTCPITGEKLLSEEAVTNTLSLMYSCGMSIYSGQFAFKNGLPAISAVSGGLMLVIPQVMGITLWSPALDRLGNSERGVQFCQELIKRYSFHRFDDVGSGYNFSYKINPTLKKVTAMSDMLIQVLLASANGDVLAVQRSYLQDFDLTMADYDGRTPLHVAAAEGHLNVVKFLLNIAKACVNPQDRWKHTPLSEAERFNHNDVANYLREFIEKNPDQGSNDNYDHYIMRDSIKPDVVGNHILQESIEEDGIGTEV